MKVLCQKDSRRLEEESKHLLKVWTVIGARLEPHLPCSQIPVKDLKPVVGREQTIEL